MQAARTVAIVLAVAALAGCGRATLGPAGAPVRTGALGAKFSADETARYRAKVEKMVAWYDKDHDGAIAAGESPVKYGQDRTYIDERFNRNWILRTEITYDLHRRVKSLQAIDGNGDGRASVAEVNAAFLRDRDTNGDDKIGVWERVKAVVMTPSGRFETRWYQETGRRQYFVYRPDRDDGRPTPPRAAEEAAPPLPTDRPQPPLKVELPEE